VLGELLLEFLTPSSLPLSQIEQIISTQARKYGLDDAAIEEIIAEIHEQYQEAQDVPKKPESPLYIQGRELLAMLKNNMGLAKHGELLKVLERLDLLEGDLSEINTYFKEL